MNIMHVWRLAAGLAVVLGLSAGVATAAPIVSVSPAQQVVAVGDAVFVDIDVDGLTDATGGFYLQVDFDGAILEALQYVVGPGLGSALDLSSPVSPAGPFELFVTSFEDPIDLPALQGTGFTLVRLEFVALADGVSPVTISAIDLSNAEGTDLLAVGAVTNGQVCVGAPCPVPEPATGALALSALGLLFARRRLSR